MATENFGDFAAQASPQTSDYIVGYRPGAPSVEQRTLFSSIITLFQNTYNAIFAQIRPTINSQSGTSYTLLIGDAENAVLMTSSSSNTVTVPPNSSVAFPIGTEIRIEQDGIGQTTIAAGSGVTINSRGNALNMAGQFSPASLFKTGTNTWTLCGDITT